MYKLGYLLLQYTIGLTFTALVLQNLMSDSLKRWGVKRQEQQRKEFP